jgi:hypothetical protein
MIGSPQASSGIARATLRHWRRSSIAVFGALIVGGAITGCTPSPPQATCGPVDFEDAEVVFTPDPTLRVRVDLTPPHTFVELRPVDYIQQPEHWEFNVVGCHVNGKPGSRPVTFTASRDLAGVLGTRGVVVVAGEHREEIDVAWDDSGPTIPNAAVPVR